ncbi:MAG: polysaccharide deacetylase family protein, partial [Verrucomicrobiales bacterium]
GEGGETPVRWFAYGWLLWIALQVPAMVVLGWRWLMRVSGVSGLVLRAILAVILHVAMVGLWWSWGWQAGVACGVGICGLWALCVFRPNSEIFGPVSKRVEGAGPLLSIDDGPHPEDTPAILDQLDDAGVKAVFFVIGEKVRQHPDLTREIVARGHELGNHTMTHPQGSMWILGPWRTWQEIQRCQETIEAVAGVRPRWFRAPVGHRNYFTHPITRALGLEVVAWTRRAYDTVDRDLERIMNRLGSDFEDGEILLIHEATPIAQRLAARLVPNCVAKKAHPCPTPFSGEQSGDC